MKNNLVVFVSLVVALLFSVAVSVRVDPLLYEQLFSGGEERGDILVHFGSLDLKPQFDMLKRMPRNERRQMVRDLLGMHAEKSQKDLREELRGEGYSVRTFWINNVLFIRKADIKLFVRLLKEPTVIELEAHKDIAHLDLIKIEKIEWNEHLKKEEEEMRLVEWNINMIRAPFAWNTTRGEGIVLSNIDTGVRYTHVALRDNYRGYDANSGSYDHDYNWLDPRATSTVPFDNHGHGTHTMGTIAGSDSVGIGVAPGAKWIAAKGCASSSCSNADLTMSFEYVVCPYRQDGSDEDCSKGADVVSNSWGGGSQSNYYDPWVQACLAAGMNVVFSQGNSGSRCGSVNSPGDLYSVIGVGSTNSDDSLSSFSSRGPGVNSDEFPRQKPDISAPGEAVRSSYYLSDTSYAMMSGTSMACPHVTGVIGLMKSVNLDMGDEQVRDILYKSSATAINQPEGGDMICGGKPWSIFPNYHYGYGRLDAEIAVQDTVAASKNH